MRRARITQAPDLKSRNRHLRCLGETRVEPAAERFARITGVQRPAKPKIVMERAVVFGASMAGLMAARVLSDHADEVLIIERDPTGDSAEPRPGVPQ